MEKQQNTPHFFNVSLKLILENEKGEILGLKNPNTSSLAGLYDFPGGRINSNELKTPLEEVLRREIQEEIGDKIQFKIDMNPSGIGRHNYFSEKFNEKACIFMIFFRAKYLDGEIMVSEEHIGYEWLKINNKNVSQYFAPGFAEGIRTYLQEKTEI